MNVLTICNQDSKHFSLRPSSTPIIILFNLKFSNLLPSLFKSQVEVQWQDLGEVLTKMLTASNLGVLELVEKLNMVFRHRGIQDFHELNGIH